MQQFIFPNNYIVPFALQNKDKQPKGNTVCDTMKNKHILRKILAEVTGKSISWKLMHYTKLKIDLFNISSKKILTMTQQKP